MTTNYKYSFDGMSTNCEPQENEFTELDHEITITNSPFKVELKNKEVELYLYIEYLNMSEYDNSQEHVITMGVIPSFKDLSEKHQDNILSQYDTEDIERIKADNLQLIEETYNYGYYIPLHSVTTTNERLNISPSKLKIVSEVQKLNCLSDILGFELVDKAEENYINITSGYDDLVAKINFINKFGDKTNFQINIKKILDNNDRE